MSKRYETTSDRVASGRYRGEGERCYVMTKVVSDRDGT